MEREIREHEVEKGEEKTEDGNGKENGDYEGGGENLRETGRRGQEQHCCWPCPPLQCSQSITLLNSDVGLIGIPKMLHALVF